jgi:hypothetical protein
MGPNIWKNSLESEELHDLYSSPNITVIIEQGGRAHLIMQNTWEGQEMRTKF